MLIAMILFFCSGSVARDCLQVPPPNIILIMADDLGYGDLGSYGQKAIQTPYLDRLAEQGTRFTSVYGGAPVCAPSRSVLMTGQHTGHTTIRENSGRRGGEKDEMSGSGHRIPLKDEDETVAEVLKRAGYATGITGKWGLGESGSTGVPNLQGFDEWYGYLNQNHAVFYYTNYLWRNDRRDTIIPNMNDSKQLYTHDLFTDFALDFICHHRKEPFFLYIPYTIPHFNLEIPSLEPYTENFDWPQSSKIYASMVSRMDRDVGRILDLLKKLNIDENTLVFFASDNGPDYSKGPDQREALFNSNGTFKGAKGDLTEGGLRVPMIVHWPGKVPAGKVSDAPWYFADVLPTLTELVGEKPSENVDGVSVLPLLLGKEQNLENRFMYWEKPPPNLVQAVRRGRWKALCYPGADGNNNIRIYDLASDPGEKYDVSAEHPEIVVMFNDYLKTARTDSPFWPKE